MRSCLFMTTRGFNANYSSLYKQMNILKEYDNITFIHKYKTERVIPYIEEHTKIKINNVINFRSKFEDVLSLKYPTWKDYYEALDVDQYKFDSVWLFGAPLSDGAKLKRRLPDTFDKMYDKNAFMKFISIASLYFDSYSLVKIANNSNVEINELCYDPGEASLSTFSLSPKVNVYHGYDIDHLGIKRLDSLQQGLKNTSKRRLFSDKDNDFILGYSYMTPERSDIHNEAQEIYKEISYKYSKKLFIKSKMTNEYNDILYDDYLDEVSRSKFTLILPSYHKNCFSAYRFIESVYNDCLPLVLESCYVDEFKSSYNLDSLIIVNKNNINSVLSMNDEDRINILNDLKRKLNL